MYNDITISHIDIVICSQWYIMCDTVLCYVTPMYVYNTLILLYILLRYGYTSIYYCTVIYD